MEKELLDQVIKLQDEETDFYIRELLRHCVLLAQERNLAYMVNIERDIDMIAENNGIYRQELMDFADDFGDGYSPYE